MPTHCVTQGLGTILAARRLVLVATGDAKAEAVSAAGLRNRPYYDDAASGLPG